LSGCATNKDRPNLSALYDQSSQYHDPWRNPIIVIPGVLGSKLVDDETGQIVWGAFGGGAVNPKKPEGARTIALPMAQGQPLGSLTDNVVSDGALDRIKVRIFGLPIQLDAYRYILSTLGIGGYRDELLGQLGAIDYGDDHYTCFQFDYDWRRDNVENAALLREFMVEKRAYVRAKVKETYGVDNPDIKFDVVAHSMGGLLLRYMLRYGNGDLPENGEPMEVPWAGAYLVDRAVLISTPNAGATETITNMLGGVQFSFLLPKYQPAVLGTFPSLYQMLPRTRHKMAVDEETGDVLDFLDPAVWESKGWGLASPHQERVLETLLPDVGDSDERKRIALDHLRKSLENARLFQEALDVPATPPEGLELFLVAGDAVMTDAVVSVGDGESVKVLEKRPGDGTTLRSSSLMDERVGGEWTPNLQSPIAWKNVNFVYKDHLGITTDHNFTDNLLYLLLESQR
jgi:pimeloyl-ACP methyl ester carboxylesterase